MAEAPLVGVIRSGESTSRNNKFIATAALVTGQVVLDLGLAAAVTGLSDLAIGDEVGVVYDVRMDVLKETAANVFAKGDVVKYDLSAKRGQLTGGGGSIIGFASKASAAGDLYVETALNFS